MELDILNLTKPNKRWLLMSLFITSWRRECSLMILRCSKGFVLKVAIILT